MSQVSNNQTSFNFIKCSSAPSNKRKGTAIVTPMSKEAFS